LPEEQSSREQSSRKRQQHLCPAGPNQPTRQRGAHAHRQHPGSAADTVPVAGGCRVPACGGRAAASHVTVVRSDAAVVRGRACRCGVGGGGQQGRKKAAAAAAAAAE
jgi:hypothetical protein